MSLADRLVFRRGIDDVADALQDATRLATRNRRDTQ
jgi:hypothetical protein